MTEVQSLRRRYSTAKQVCERYGGRSGMWLWRILKNDPNFPRPLITGQGKLRLFDDDELDAYDEFCKRGGANATP